MNGWRNNEKLKLTSNCFDEVFYLKISNKWNTYLWNFVPCITYIRSSFKASSSTINLRLFESQSSRLSLSPHERVPLNLQIKFNAFIKITFYILFRVRRAISFAMACFPFHQNVYLDLKTFMEKSSVLLVIFCWPPSCSHEHESFHSQSHTFSTLKEQLFIKLNYSAT